MSSTEFSYRFNANGTFDAICHRCFRTIATASIEADHRPSEQEHVCDPFDLIHLYFGDTVAVSKRQASKI